MSDTIQKLEKIVEVSAGHMLCQHGRHVLAQRFVVFSALQPIVSPPKYLSCKILRYQTVELGPFIELSSILVFHHVPPVHGE